LVKKVEEAIMEQELFQESAKAIVLFTPSSQQKKDRSTFNMVKPKARKSAKKSQGREKKRLAEEEEAMRDNHQVHFLAKVASKAVDFLRGLLIRKHERLIMLKALAHEAVASTCELSKDVRTEIGDSAVDINQYG
jgi:hypothetical protein